MKTYRIGPKDFISFSYIIDYFDYTKKEALRRYRQQFPQFKRSEIKIY